MTVSQRWVRVYTAGLPAQVRGDRCDEIASDLHEQLADADGAAAAQRAARRDMVGRTVRGAVDDLVWRREVGRAMSSKSLRAVVSQAWWAPVGVLVLIFDVGLAAAILADDQSTMPGRVGGPALILATALAMAVGLTVRLGVPPVPGARGPVAAAVAGAVVVMAALAVLGVGGPAVLLVAGLFAVVAVAGIARSAVRSSAAADALILLGTLPALMMFWLVLPALLAVAVVVGVLTSHARAVPTPA